MTRWNIAQRQNLCTTDGSGVKLQVRLLDPRLREWGFPHYGSALAAGLDLHACLDEPLTLVPGAAPSLISSGLAVRIGDPGWCGVVAPRSGLGHRGLVLGNLVGVIDADYEGPCLISAWNRNAQTGSGEGSITIHPGDRIAQLLFVPVLRPEFDVVDNFTTPGVSDVVRGGGGFGSTGVTTTMPKTPSLSASPNKGGRAE